MHTSCAKTEIEEVRAEENMQMNCVKLKDGVLCHLPKVQPHFSRADHPLPLFVFAVVVCLLCFALFLRVSDDIYSRFSNHS